MTLHSPSTPCELAAVITEARAAGTPRRARPAEPEDAGKLPEATPWPLD